MNSYKSIKSNFVPFKGSLPPDIQNLKLTQEEWMSKFNQILDQKKIPIVLLYGTCLGIYRDKKIIKNDTDADFGIYIEDLSKLHSLIDELRSAGFTISGRGVYQITFKIPNSQFYIDIWPIKKISNLALKVFGYKWEKDHVYFKENYFGNPTEILFDNHRYFLPTPTEHYLEKLYGHDWKIPIAGRFSGPRGLLSQYINKVCVDFPVPSQFSGSNSLGTFKPWVSKVLKLVAPNSAIFKLYKHPK